MKFFSLSSPCFQKLMPDRLTHHPPGSLTTSQILASWGLLAVFLLQIAAWSSKNNEPGTTIAAHVEHLRWSLANANAALQGKPYNSNWKESWNTVDTDEMKWAQLKQDLKTEFEALRLNLQKQTELSGRYMLGVMALVPHAAYHLGTIRQLIERARENLKGIA